MGFFSRWLKKSPVSVAQKFSESPVNISQVAQIPIDWFGTGVYDREAAVRTVIDHIARNIASMPFKVYTRQPDGDRVEDTTSPLAQLMAKPSVLPGMTRYRFFYSLLCDGLLNDRWLCLLDADKKTGRLWLRRIPVQNFTLSGNTLDEITGVQISTGQPEGSQYFKLPDPQILLDVGYSTSGIGGSPVSGTLAPLLAEAREMAEYRRAIAKNGGQIPAYISRPKEMPWPSQEAQDEFVQGMRNYKSGGNLAGGWPLLNDGMEIKTVDAFKPIDMQDIDARDKIRIDVANAFHIAPENLGFRSGTNSNIASFKEQMWNVELMPYIVAFEQSLNLLLPDALGQPDAYIEANVDAKLRGTFSEQYQALSTATGRSFMTTNEARRILNYPKLDGGDELVTPLNVATGAQPSPQDGGRTQNAQQNNPVNGEGQ